MLNEIRNEDMVKFAVTGKLGLLSTLAPDGFPHVSLISSLQAKNDKQMMWGQFTYGLSKIYIEKQPKTGFLILDMDKNWWRGRTIYKESKITGEDYDMYNNQPLFRYNSYLGIGKVHYMDLVDYSGMQALPMKGIVKGAFLGRVIKGLIKKSTDKNVKIQNFTQKLAQDLTSLKFLCYEDREGFPVLLPVIQAFMKDKFGRMIIPLTAFKEELSSIPKGAKVALYLANLDLCGVLLQGEYGGVMKTAGMSYAVFDTQKVYNTNLPVVGYIYPQENYKIIH